MQSLYDYRKYAILYVDDEEKSLKYFARAFEDQFQILTASSAQEGLKALEENQDRIGILMTDQRMPGEKGTWLLEKARQLRPRIVRILATAFSDMDAAIAAVNTGAIYKYVTKPWDPPQLEATLKRGLEFFIVQRERDQLLKEKLSVLHNVMIADRIIGLGLLAAGLSHHIRNSLVAVKTFLDLAPAKLREEQLDLNSLRNPGFWKDYYQNVQGQIDKINGLLRDLWSASDHGNAAFNDQVQLQTEVDTVLSTIQSDLATKALTIENRIPRDFPSIVADRTKIRKMLHLLLRDEWVSLPAGSHVTISAEATDPDRIRLSIRDNGPGLPEEALRVIFDPFALRSDTPMEYGVNLIAAYFIVHHHGGRIHAESTPNQGTLFTLTLPLDANQQPKAEEDAAFVQKALLNEKLWERLLAAE
jgi:two-component system, probable response regulator PhcQ